MMEEEEQHSVIGPPSSPKCSFPSPRLLNGKGKSVKKVTTPPENLEPSSQHALISTEKRNFEDKYHNEDNNIPTKSVERQLFRSNQLSSPDDNSLSGTTKSGQIKSALLKSMSSRFSSVQKLETQTSKASTRSCDKESEFSQESIQESDSHKSLPGSTSKDSVYTRPHLPILQIERNGSDANYEKCDISDTRSHRVDSANSERSGGFFFSVGARNRADVKAQKKIEWLETYLQACAQENIPADSPDILRSKHVLERYKSRHTLDEAEALPMDSPANDTDQDVKNLRKQLADANKVIEKLRIERALIHAHSEIVKLKTEIRYGHESENEDPDIDKIFPISSNLPSNSVNQFSNESESPCVVSKNANSEIKSVNVENSANDGKNAVNPSDSQDSGTRQSKSNDPVNVSTKPKNIWAKLRKEVESNGTEFLAEDKEKYREEKKKKKQRKVMLRNVGEALPSFEKKEEVSPMLKKQVESPEFLAFLNTLNTELS